MEQNSARTNLEQGVEPRRPISIRDRMMNSATGVGGTKTINDSGVEDIVKKELRELRQDINIVAQHIVAIRNEMKDKIKVVSDTADDFEQVTKAVLESVIQKISDGELDTFSEALGQIIKEDDENNRKKLFEDIERAIINQTPKAKSSSISLMQWLINLSLIGGVVAIYLMK